MNQITTSETQPDSIQSIKSYPCPKCKKAVVWSKALFKPFCSERCKMIDFGAWAAEEHVIPGSHQDENYDEF